MTRERKDVMSLTYTREEKREKPGNYIPEIDRVHRKDEFRINLLE